jgi:hypothetical protein
MKIEGHIAILTPIKNTKGSYTEDVTKDTMTVDFMPLFDVDKSGNENLLCYEGTFTWNRKNKAHEMNVEAYLYANVDKEVVTVVSPLKLLPEEASILLSAVGFSLPKSFQILTKTNYVNNL